MIAKSRSPKKWLLLLPVPAIMLFAIFAIMHSPKLQDKLSLKINNCHDPVFTVAPVDKPGFNAMIPLGNVNVPDHTLPTDHIYYVFDRSSNDAPVPVTSVAMPGDATLNRITYVSTDHNGLKNEDYKLDFAPCSAVSAYFDHIHVLSDKLKSAYGSKADCETHNSTPTTTEIYCTKNVSLKLKAGEIVGQAGGGLAAGFDFGAIDNRTKPLPYANPSRYGTLHAVCPIDLFGDPLKTQLQANFQRRGPGPKCGEVDQDKPGTAQGNWFNGPGSASKPERWKDTLSLVHDNKDSTQGVAAIAGDITDPLKISFTPQHSQSYNREFSEITPGPEVYCYDGRIGGLDPRLGGQLTSNKKVLLRLTDSQHLSVEVQDGNCGSSWSFGRPTTYQR